MCADAQKGMEEAYKDLPALAVKEKSSKWFDFIDRFGSTAQSLIECSDKTNLTGWRSLSLFFSYLGSTSKAQGIRKFLSGFLSKEPFNNRFCTGLALDLSGSLTFDSLKGSGYLKKLLIEESFTKPFVAWKDIKEGVNLLKNPNAAGGDLNRLGKISGLAKYGPGAAKLLKGGLRAVGFISDGVSLYDTFAKSKAAYVTTKGDHAQKKAAAVVEAGEGRVRFGVGKAVGVAIGTCLGGPVDTVIGLGIGWGVDKLLDFAKDRFDESDAKKSLINWVGKQMRGGKEMSSSHRDAFASG